MKLYFNSRTILFSSLFLVLILFVSLFVYAQSSGSGSGVSANKCSALSSSSKLSLSFHTFISDTNLGQWPFISPSGVGLPPPNFYFNPLNFPTNAILNPSYNTEVQNACTSAIFAYSNSIDYAPKALACVKQCTRNNSPPSFICSGALTLSCVPKTAVSEINCLAIPFVTVPGSPLLLSSYSCQVPLEVIGTCTCAGEEPR
ncbi:hypothetical protein EXS72_00665 [Candidatus Pacearchaeota archaeon]|nr:hypothetical protein [Candidatus Pacearchaeota archaeon]